MPTFDISFKARYASGDEGRDTYKMDGQEDVGVAIAEAFSLFVSSEMQDGRASPVGLSVEANQR